MNYELVDPRQIEQNPWNANVVSDEMSDKLRASIKRNGMFKPILVRTLDDGTLQSIGGKHRAEQAVELGFETVPIINLGQISDERAKEISLADNARYGVDDTMKLGELIDSLNRDVVMDTLPFESATIDAITRSLAISIDDLDLDSIDDAHLADETDEQEEAKPERTIKTHQLLRFKCSISDAARISTMVNKTMKSEGFTKEDDLTNAGDALAFLLLSETDAEV